MSDIEDKKYIKIIERYTIKSGTRMICNSAFAECNNLKEVLLPSSINFIGEDAFLGCVKLDKLVLPNSLVYIGDRAFDCEDYPPFFDSEPRSNPLVVSISPSVEMIDGNPFCYNSILQCNNKRFKVIDNVLFSADGKVLISYCSNENEYIVPNGVVRIGVGAFRNTPIKKIQFPNTLEVIDKQAFEDASELINISFPESLKEIRYEAFHRCDFGTGKVSFPGNIEKIAPSAFEFGWLIKMIRVPKGRLEHYRFILPEWISSQIYDDNTIYENNLYLSSDRKEVLTAIIGLKNYIIPEGIISIRDNAFDSIYYINSIQFPSTLRRISMKVFDKEIQELKKVKVPKGTKEQYMRLLPKFCNVIKEYE